MNDVYWETLDRKLGSFERTIETSNNLIRDMISEMKRSNDTVITHLEYMKKDSERVEKELLEVKAKLNYLEGEVTRIGFLGKNLQELVEGQHPSAEVETWFNSKLSKTVFWVLGIIGAVILSGWANGLILK